MALGVAPGDAVMVHASVHALGEVAGGPDEIHLALKDALTSEGTLHDCALPVMERVAADSDAAAAVLG